jgi:molybdopterin synthase sulfurtransferase
MTSSIPVISTDFVKDHLENTQSRIVDIRHVDAYNGWQLLGESRGGHIPGAKSLPFKWTRYIDWIEMVRYKGLNPHHKVIIYEYFDEEMEKVGSLFQKAGFDQLFFYPGFMTEWVADEELPLSRLAHYQQLVPASWVKQLTEHESPIHYNNDKFRLVHAHYRNRDAYLSGHIPGAIDLDTNALESPDTWNRRSPEELKKALEDNGITADTTVIMYGKYMSPDNNDLFPGSAAGDIGAVRCAFIMMYAGVKDVRVINGGFQSWQDAGYEILFDDVPKEPVADFGVTIPACPGLAVDTPEAKQMLTSPAAELVCVRSWPEYTGEVSGYIL